MIESNKHYSTALDCCRWIAAFLVVISHVRHMLFTDYGNIIHKSGLMKAFYFLTGLGDEAVIVFFVLSGLLVGGSAARKFLAGRYDARDYAIHRFSRIYTVLIPALVIGGLLDMIGMTYFNDSMLYTNHRQYLTTPIVDVVAHNLSLSTFFGNVLLTQTWLVPVLGSNNPLWSLTSEWWFYCLFWAVLSVASPRQPNIVRIAYLGFTVAMAVALPQYVTLWFSIWLIGVAMAFSDKIRYRIPPLAGIAVFAATLIGVRFVRSISAFADSVSLEERFGLDMTVAIGFCVLLVSLSRIRTFRFGPSGFHRMMAGFSYTTYLVHFPMMVFLAAFFYACFGIRFVQQPALFTSLYLLATIIFLYLYSFAFAKCTEGKTAYVRRFIQNLAGLRIRRVFPFPASAESMQTPSGIKEVE